MYCPMTMRSLEEAYRSGIILQWLHCQNEKWINVRLPVFGSIWPLLRMNLKISEDPDTVWIERGEESSTGDITILSATAFDNLLDSNKTIQAFSLWIGTCCHLLQVTMEVTTFEHPGEIEAINTSAGQERRKLLCKMGRVEHSYILAYLRLARTLILVVCWTNTDSADHGRITWSIMSPFYFPIIPNCRSETETSLQMPHDVLYLLLIEVISLWDTQTMCISLVTIWPRLPLHWPNDHLIDLQPHFNLQYGRILNHLCDEPKAPKVNIKIILSTKLIHQVSAAVAVPITFAIINVCSLQLYVDYWANNKATVKNCYPQPQVSETLNRLHKGLIITTLDHLKAYDHMKNKDGNTHQTAFPLKCG